MTGTTHYLAGAAIGKVTGNPILGAVFGFIFHFVMDLVPHWDYGLYLERKFRKFVVAACDPIFGFLVYLLIGYLCKYDLDTWIVTFVGGFFCLLPDVMGIFIRIFRIKALRPLNVFHDRVHWFIKEEKDAMDFKKREVTKKSFIFGILYQVPFLALSIYLLIK